MSAVDNKPCPYCGETIKVNAVKCRFCGEFLDEEPEEQKPQKKQREGGAAKWLVPVGRNIWALMAGYFGIFALLPYGIVFWGFAKMDDNVRTSTEEAVLYLGCGVNAMLGLIALAFGLIALITLLKSEKSGLGRAIFAMSAGLLGALLNFVLIYFYWMPTYVKQTKPLPPPPTGAPAKKTAVNDTPWWYGAGKMFVQS